MTTRNKRKRFRIPAITPKELKEAAEWLWEHKCGCYHKLLWVGEDGREWDIVVGWLDWGRDRHEDELEKAMDCERFYREDDGENESWYVTGGIRYQTPNNGMQTDMDIDFMIPWFDTGDCYDLSTRINRPYKGRRFWRVNAAELNRYAREIYRMRKEFA